MTLKINLILHKHTKYISLSINNSSCVSSPRLKKTHYMIKVSEGSYVSYKLTRIYQLQKHNYHFISLI